MAKIIAFIPARGGSKGIPHKNIAPLAGQPLIAYSIAAAKASRLVQNLYTSSDDVAILTVAEALGSQLIRRDPALAQDASPTNPVIAEFIEKAALADADIVVLLQPTSPLRTAQHIDEALELFLQHPDARALISVCLADSKYFYAYSGADPYLTPLVPSAFQITRRQDLPAIYLPNGAIYIFRVGAFRDEQRIPLTQVLAYSMTPEMSIDIDTPDDLRLAESQLIKAGE